MSDELTDAYLDLMMGRGDREAPGEQGTPDEWLDWTRSVLGDRAAWLGYWRRAQDSDELRDLPSGYAARSLASDGITSCRWRTGRLASSGGSVRRDDCASVQ